MSSVIINPPFNIDVNFWTNNSPFRLIDPFSKIYDSDKSKNKIESSKLMWCLWLLTNPATHNPIRRLSKEEKLKSIKHYYSKFSLRTKLMKMAFEKFEMFAYTTAAKNFRESEDFLVRRKSLINSMMEKLERIEKGEELKEYTSKVTGETYTTPVDLFDKEVQAGIKSLEARMKKTEAIYKAFDSARAVFEQE